ncbi:hypothetical protein Hanom_Chr07g00655481 [Helianthus anomalus]
MKCMCQRSLEYQQRPEQVHEMEPEWQQKNRTVLVVCFLCTNRQLQHAHFIEVALASPEGFFRLDKEITNWCFMRVYALTIDLALLTTFTCTHSYQVHLIQGVNR